MFTENNINIKGVAQNQDQYKIYKNVKEYKTSSKYVGGGLDTLPAQLTSIYILTQSTKMEITHIFHFSLFPAVLLRFFFALCFTKTSISLTNEETSKLNSSQTPQKNDVNRNVKKNYVKLLITRLTPKIQNIT